MFYYKQIKEGKITSVEAKSKASISPNFIEATKAEYDTSIASLPRPDPPKPTRDLEKEIDELKARLDEAGIGIIRKS